MTTTTRTRYNNRPTATNPSHARTTSAPSPHYRLSIESSSSTTMDHEGQVEVVTLIDLIATHEHTDARYAYVGKVPCSTRDEALTLMSAILKWERGGSVGRELDPTRYPELWAKEGEPKGFYSTKRIGK